MARSTSPLASASALRQSLKPAPVRSRNSLTNCAGTLNCSGFVAISANPQTIIKFGWMNEARHEPAAQSGFGLAFRLNGLFGIGKFRRLHKIAFLLFVSLIGAGVDIFDVLHDFGAFGSFHLFACELGLLKGSTTLDNGIGNLGCEKANGAQRVIISRNH